MLELPRVSVFVMVLVFRGSSLGQDQAIQSRWVVVESILYRDYDMLDEWVGCDRFEWGQLCEG